MRKLCDNLAWKRFLFTQFVSKIIKQKCGLECFSQYPASSELNVGSPCFNLWSLVQAPGKNRLNLKIDLILDSNSKESNLLIVRGTEGGEDERPWKTLKGEVNRLRMRENCRRMQE